MPWRAFSLARASELAGVTSLAGDIPAEFVVGETFEYYIETLDGATAVSDPAQNPTQSPHVVRVLQDPGLVHAPPPFAVADKPLRIDFDARCENPDCQARLFYSPTRETALEETIRGQGGPKFWANVGMTAAPLSVASSALGLGNKGFAATIPASAVDTRGVDYAIRLTDGNAISWSPGPGRLYDDELFERVETLWHHVHVVEAPRIVHTPTAAALYQRPIDISGTATCAPSRTCTARLYYRVGNGLLLDPDSTFASVPMTVSRRLVGPLDAIEARGTIPASAATTRGVDYFFSVTDGSRTAWWPGTSSVDGYVSIDGTRVGYGHIRVLEPPHILPQASPSTAPSLPYRVRATVSCVTQQCSADLFYAPGAPARSGSYQRVPMQPIAQRPSIDLLGRVTVYEAFVPPDDVTTAGLSWFIRGSDGHLSTFSPGTPYLGGPLPIGDERPGAITSSPIQLNLRPDTSLPGGSPQPQPAVDTGIDLAWMTDVRSAPEVLPIDPRSALKLGEDVPVDTFVVCGAGSCNAELSYTTGDGTWTSVPMQEVPLDLSAAPPEVRSATGLEQFSVVIPKEDVGRSDVAYRIVVTDGYVSTTSTTRSILASQRLARVKGRVSFEAKASLGLDRGAPASAVEVGFKPVIAGVAVPLALVTTSTDADGRYRTDLIPGEYVVEVNPATLPAGAKASAQSLTKTRIVGLTDDLELPFDLATLDTDDDEVADVAEFDYSLDGGSAQDEDGDGLTDGFEIRFGYPAALPDQADSDADGTVDGLEDADGDSLTAEQEEQFGSDPMSKDTDSDGLVDARERQIGTNPRASDTDGDGLRDASEADGSTNPLVEDSDADGVSDGDEITTTTREFTDGVTVAISGRGDVAGALQVTSLGTGGPLAAAELAQVAPSWDIHLDEQKLDDATFESANVSLPIPSSVPLEERANLRVFTWDDVHGAWMPSSTSQEVDELAGTVTATVDHFSVYTLFNIVTWKQRWTTTVPGCQGNPPTLDLAVAIDVGVQTMDNDPGFTLRKAVARAFFGALDTQDRAGISETDDSTRIITALTADHSRLEPGLQQLEFYNRPADLGQVIHGGNSVLRAAPREENRARAMILLTAGWGNFDSQIDAAVAQSNLGNVAIFPIAIGDSVREAKLREIAQRTGGRFHQVRTTADVPLVASRVTRYEVNGDFDDDGVGDCDESDGALDAATGRLFFSDPHTDDTDGDGLLDGEELGHRLNTTDVEQFGTNLAVQVGTKPIFNVVSDPMAIDSDADNLDDLDEYDRGSSPRSNDIDGDGANDVYEETLGTDPRLADTDADGLTDLEEDRKLDLGFDPLVPDEQIGRLTYLREFSQGLTGGLIGQGDTIAFLMGDLAGGVIGVSDVGAFFVGLAHGDIVSAGLSLAGLVPVFGDVPASIAKVVRFVRRVPEKSRAAVRAVLNSRWFPSGSARAVLEQVEGVPPEALQRLARHDGITDDVVALLRVGDTGDMVRFADFLDNAVSVGRVMPDGTPVREFTSASDAQNTFATALGGSEQMIYRLNDADRLELADRYRALDIATGPTGSRVPQPVANRRPDVVVRDGNGDAIAVHEIKNGRGCGAATRAEIVRDHYLFEKNKSPQVEYHFTANTVPGPAGTARMRLAPCADVQRLLTELSIPYHVYFP